METFPIVSTLIKQSADIFIIPQATEWQKQNVPLPLCRKEDHVEHILKSLSLRGKLQLLPQKRLRLPGSMALGAGDTSVAPGHRRESRMQFCIKQQVQEVIMKHNVGGFDLTVRIVVGMGLLLAGLIAPISTLWQILALVVAAVALITAVLQFCPINALLGINTCKVGDDKHHPA